MRKIVELKIEETKTIVGGVKAAAATVAAQPTITAKEMRALSVQSLDMSVYA